MGDFYGTGIETWAGFGPVGITDKKEIQSNYMQLFRLVFFEVFMRKIEILTKIKTLSCPH